MPLPSGSVNEVAEVWKRSCAAARMESAVSYAFRIQLIDAQKKKDCRTAVLLEAVSNAYL
jgi:hypothetical protein